MTATPLAVARGLAQTAGKIESGASMTMRVNTIITHLRPEGAFTLVEFLDQLRAMSIETYGDDIRAPLQEAFTQGALREWDAGEDEAF